MNPLDALESKFAALREDITRDVKIAVYREFTRLLVGRLIELDSGNKVDYLKALQILEGDK